MVARNEEGPGLEDSTEATSYNGTWSVQIGSDVGWQTLGVLVLENGRAMGGGDRSYSRGTYEESEGKLHMSLHVHYYRSPRILFGATEKDIDLLFVGERLQDTVQGYAERPDMPGMIPGMTLSVRLTWKAPLLEAT
jgi:hypothetical protein